MGAALQGQGQAAVNVRTTDKILVKVGGIW